MRLTAESMPNNTVIAADSYYEIDTPLLAINQWPAALIDLALCRGIAEHKLLRNTGIFCTDLNCENVVVSPQQLLQLIRNIQKHLPNRDISFLLGQQLFAGTNSSISQQFIHAEHLQAALDYLLNNQAQLSPLLDLRLSYEREQVVIYWQDCCGAQDVLFFLIETMNSAINALCNWRVGRSLPWQFYFAHPEPDYIEQHQVHLDGHLAFNSRAHSILINRDYLYLPWQHLSNMSLVEFPTSTPTPTGIYQQGFLSAVYRYLYNNIQQNPNLEQTATAFGMSSASFKRKLQKHHSHFQAQYDLVRKDLAIYWLHQEGWSNEQVARKLHFHDAANLRRAFKKWTGLTPQDVRS